MTTYEIDATGLLRAPVMQQLGRDTAALAGEPGGRFAFAGQGAWTVYGGGTREGSDLTVAAYGADPNGALSERFDVTVVPAPPSACSGCVDDARWLWLKAGAGRIHGFWRRHWGTAGHRLTYSYVSIPLSSDGAPGRASQTEFPPDRDPGEVTVDVLSDILYKAGSYSGQEVHPRGLEAHVIGPDGTLTQMGWTNLCLGGVECHSCTARPLTTARGFHFAIVPTTRRYVCSYQGLRLKPYGAFEFSASVAEAFVPSSEAEPTLVAMGVPVEAGDASRSELRVFSMGADGDLRLLDGDELPSAPTQLLFHPSGRFLYVIDIASRLRAYRLDPGGRLELTTSIDRATSLYRPEGSMAVTLRRIAGGPSEG